MIAKTNILQEHLETLAGMTQPQRRVVVREARAMKVMAESAVNGVATSRAQALDVVIEAEARDLNEGGLEVDVSNIHVLVMEPARAS